MTTRELKLHIARDRRPYVDPNPNNPHLPITTPNQGHRFPPAPLCIRGLISPAPSPPPYPPPHTQALPLQLQLPAAVQIPEELVRPPLDAEEAMQQSLERIRWFKMLDERLQVFGIEPGPSRVGIPFPHTHMSVPPL